MNILIACESSGVVRDAFRAKGHNAWSCDLLPSESSCHGPHLEGDVRRWLNPGSTPHGGPWDMMIAHPPCTYLNSAGLHWITRGRIESDGRPRIEHQHEALAFVQFLMDAPIARICIENPAGCIGTKIRPADQWIQPNQFGDDASKKTGLWLKGLPPLVPTLRIPGRMVEYPPGSGKMVERWANQTDSGQNNLGPSPTRWKERSKTYPGIASAMADQWGPLVQP